MTTTYQVTSPPEAAWCDTRGCGSIAEVRVLIPRPGGTVGWGDHSPGPGTFDTCGWHWPVVRAVILRNGHHITDTAGDLGQLTADYPGWKLFASDEGRLSASARLPGHVQGTTVHAFLIGPLRAKIDRTMSQARPTAMWGRI